MPGCALHVQGRGLACPPELKTLGTSPGGFVVLISDAAGDSFARQVEDATAFLEAHAPTLAALSSSSGLEAAELDFGGLESDSRAADAVARLSRPAGRAGGDAGSACG